MEMGNTEKKMKANNSRLIYYLLNHEMIFDYILQTDFERPKLTGILIITTMSQQQLCSWIVLGEEYMNDSEQGGKFFLVMIKFFKRFLE